MKTTQKTHHRWAQKCAINIATIVFVWNFDIHRMMREQVPTIHGGSNIVFNLQVVIHIKYG